MRTYIEKSLKPRFFFHSFKSKVCDGSPLERHSMFRIALSENKPGCLRVVHNCLMSLGFKAGNVMLTLLSKWFVRVSLD